jgi:phthalate 4,5-dioxygenase oxygenase subunit
VTGACVDMPSEPAESNFKSKVRTKAYPCSERGGIVWAYMGPRSSGEEPPLPDLEANMLPEGESAIYNLYLQTNFMQNWEGEMDTAHAAFLHGSFTPRKDLQPGSAAYFVEQNKAPRFSVLDTEFGTAYGAYRPAGEDSYYWRIAHMLFPFYAMIPTGTLGLNIFWRAYVPMDDEHTLMWTQVGGREGDRRITWLPNTTDWYGRFRITQGPENGFLQDRELQKTGESYTGIPGGARPQDMAVTWSMGTVYDRSREHLGTTDQLIIKTRRRMLAAVRAHRDQGVIPPGVDEPQIYQQRSGGVVLPRSADWWEGTKDLRKAFVKHEGLKPLVGV